MPNTNSLQEIYTDELKDLWSANDQMTRMVKIMAAKADDPALRQSLEQSIGEIKKHAEMVKSMLTEIEDDAEKEHCKGMEGLVKEATKHVTTEAPEDRELLDIVIIAQYQRMSHYGIAGFGTAAAYAKALGMKEEFAQLAGIVGEIQEGDSYASELAVRAEKAAAAVA